MKITKIFFTVRVSTASKNFSNFHFAFISLSALVAVSTAESRIIIPPDSDAVYNSDSHPQRNRNLQEINTFGRMNWQ